MKKIGYIVKSAFKKNYNTKYTEKRLDNIFNKTIVIAIRQSSIYLMMK